MICLLCMYVKSMYCAYSINHVPEKCKQNYTAFWIVEKVIYNIVSTNIYYCIANRMYVWLVDRILPFLKKLTESDRARELSTINKGESQWKIEIGKNNCWSHCKLHFRNLFFEPYTLQIPFTNRKICRSSDKIRCYNWYVQSIFIPYRELLFNK